MRSEIFIRAAKLIAGRKENFACVALMSSVHGDDSTYQEQVLYKNYFQQVRLDVDGGWFGPAAVPNARLARELSLLFMAEMIKGSDV